MKLGRAHSDVLTRHQPVITSAGAASAGVARQCAMPGTGRKPRHETNSEW